MWDLPQDFGFEELLAKVARSGQGPKHGHACMDCGIEWEHTDASIYLPHEEFVKAHQCPQCGREQRFKNSDFNKYCGLDIRLPRETRLKAQELNEAGHTPEYIRKQLGLQ